MRRLQFSNLQSLIPIIVGLALIFLFFRQLAFTNLILARGDTFLYFYPYWDYRAQELLAGHLPLWNPYLFMGAPFLANPQAGVFYPLNWPLIFFPAPLAIKISILLHLVIAYLGTHLFAHKTLGQSPLAALFSASLFTLGGYLTAQVEHINQLQALAWLPWLLWAASNLKPQTSNYQLPIPNPQNLIHLCTLAVLFSLVLLAGHTQTAFIIAVALTLYTFSHIITRSPARPLTRSLASLLPLFLTFTLALLLAAAQLLPTLELSRQSLRSGGLPLREALSFSLDPRLLARALLPGYSRGLFSEFTAYLSLTGLTLAVFSLTPLTFHFLRFTLHASRPTLYISRLPLLLLALLGLTFALGAYNPLYILLANFPPFNLFRVPARWLVLFAFAIAILAGHGLDDLRHRPFGFLNLGFGIFLICLSPLANHLTPPGELGPLGAPTLRDLAGWLTPLVILALATFALRFTLHASRFTPHLIFTLSTLELFLAARVLPYQHLTAPEAYTSIRPAMTQLLITNYQSPPPRFLSLSALRFDPGDSPELHAALDSQLPADAVYDFIITTKHKEVLSPNLSLTWRIPTVDGFDGGILPLKHYAQFTSLFTGDIIPDGRLRENITALPDQRLLSLINAGYLLTDKADDFWAAGAFYDQQITLRLAAGQTATVAYLPQFTATALGLIVDNASGSVQLTFADGSTLQSPISNLQSFIPSNYQSPITYTLIPFSAPALPIAITFIGPAVIRGAALLDRRSDAFQTLTLGQYHLVHSGDLKIYENLTTLPRAFVVPNMIAIRDDTAALAALADPNFDPASTVIISDKPSPLPPRSPAPLPPVTFTEYTPNVIRLTATGPGYLLLTDADYPGWVATIDNVPTPIHRADLMFRALELPEGEHAITFRYDPLSVKIGFLISGLTWLAVFIICIRRIRSIR